MRSPQRRSPPRAAHASTKKVHSEKHARGGRVGGSVLTVFLIVFGRKRRVEIPRSAFGIYSVPVRWAATVAPTPGAGGTHAGALGESSNAKLCQSPRDPSFSRWLYRSARGSRARPPAEYNQPPSLVDAGTKPCRGWPPTDWATGGSQISFNVTSAAMSGRPSAEIGIASARCGRTYI